MDTLLEQSVSRTSSFTLLKWDSTGAMVNAALRSANALFDLAPSRDVVAFS
jgi:hypothetical protein